MKADDTYKTLVKKKNEWKTSVVTSPDNLRCTDKKKKYFLCYGIKKYHPTNQKKII